MVDKDKLVNARTLYDAAAEKGLTTGQVDWVAIYGARGVQWQFEEKPNANGEIARVRSPIRSSLASRWRQFGREEQSSLAR